MLPNKRGARAGPGRPGERRSGQGRAGRHRVHAPGRGPASADGDQPRPGRRRRRPRQAGPRAMRRRPAISPTPVSSWPCRCGWVTAPPAVPTWKTTALAATGALRPCSTVPRARSAQVIEAMARRPDVDPANVVALGQSVGGGSTVALAAAGRPACAPPSISRAVRAGIRSNRLASPAGPSACRKPMPATLRPPACPCSGSIPRTTCTGAGMAATLGRGLQRRRRPCAIRTPGAGRRQRPFAVHACAREMEAAGARLPACAGLRHAGAGRGIRPERAVLNVNADGSFHPPAAPRQATPPLARSTWPLTQPPSGPARNATTPAMSSGWPSRSSGGSLA